MYLNMCVKIKRYRKNIIYFLFLLAKNVNLTNSSKFFSVYVFEYSYLAANNIHVLFALLLSDNTVCHNYVTRAISVLSIKDEYIFSLYFLNIMKNIRRSKMCNYNESACVCTHICALVCV